MPWQFHSTGRDAGYCHECGENITLASRPGLVERLRCFLVSGGSPPGVWTCSNGHHTDGRTGATLLLRGYRVSRGLRVTTGIARAIHGERRMQPVPLVYVVAGGVGLVVGVGMDMWLEWPWWLVMLGFLMAVWLFFLSTAFWGSSRPRLMQRIRYQFDFEGQHRRELASLVARVNGGAIPAYGLAGWGGPRRLGGWGGSASEITSLGLRHLVDLDDPRHAIEVEYNAAPLQDRTALEEQLREEFVVNSVELSEAEQPGDFGRRMVLRRWEAMRRPAPPWEETSIEVEGALVVFATLVRPGAFAAIAPVAGGFLIVHAEGHEPGSFVVARITDIGPYVAGTLDAMERRSKP